MVSPLRDIYINDDQITFTCVFPTQYSVCVLDPFEVKFTKTVEDVTLGSCATCCAHRYIAFSGLPADPKFDTRSVLVINNDNGESNEIFRRKFEKHILSFRLTHEYVLCAFENELHISSHKTNELVHTIRYAMNIYAPLAVSRDFRDVICSGNDKLDLHVYSLPSKREKEFRAADNPVSIVVYSHRPQYYATTSCAGHTIKVWRSDDHECVIKFKRGNTASIIHSCDFSPNNEFLVVLSQNGTLHFFDIRLANGRSAPTVRAMSRTQIQENQIAYLSWFSPTNIAVVGMSGIATIITVSETDCQEVGREQLIFINRILEKISS